MLFKKAKIFIFQALICRVLGMIPIVDFKISNEINDVVLSEAIDEHDPVII